MSVILFLVILAVLIVSHEFGHFWAAKKAAIRVDEFAIGFPPKLFSWTSGETKYSLNLLPFGGFVKIYGEDPNEETLYGPARARSFTSKSRLVQASVVVAGVVFNALLAWLLFSISFMMGVSSSAEGAPAGVTISDVGLTITSVFPKSPAEAAGLQAGDRIVEIGTSIDNPRNTPLTPESDRSTYLTPEAVQAFIAAHPKEKIAVIYTRQGEMGSVIVVPGRGIVEDRAAIGVALDLVGIVKFPLHTAILEGGKLTLDLAKRTVQGIAALMKDALRGEGSLASLTGPVGIVSLVGMASEFGFSYLLTFIGLISINLAVLNLLPLPALDGGRLLFISIESIIRRPIAPQIVNGLNALGFLLIIGLMLLVTYHDIVRLLA